jgi:hypothetical protein
MNLLRRPIDALNVVEMVLQFAVNEYLIFHFPNYTLWLLPFLSPPPPPQPQHVFCYYAETRQNWEINEQTKAKPEKKSNIQNYETGKFFGYYFRYKLCWFLIYANIKWEFVCICVCVWHL